MRKCLAGPFVGEFGWELFCWQGFLRKRRSEFDHITVLSRPGHGVLYEDFADEFIEVEASFDKINMWMGGINVEPIVSYYKRQGNFTDLIPFDRYKLAWWLKHSAQQIQKFFKYGKSPSRHASVDILMHVRHAFHCRNNYKNWYIDDAREYAKWALDQGFTIACIGKSETSLLIEGVVDYRDIELTDLVDLYSACGVLVGAQSGPTHLASLCGLQIISWQARKEHAQRLLKTWNPFNVRAWTNPAPDSYRKTKKHWQPPLEWLQQSTIEALNR